MCILVFTHTDNIIINICNCRSYIVTLNIRCWLCDISIVPMEVAELVVFLPFLSYPKIGVYQAMLNTTYSR